MPGQAGREGERTRASFGTTENNGFSKRDIFEFVTFGPRTDSAADSSSLRGIIIAIVFSSVCDILPHDDISRSHSLYGRSVMLSVVFLEAGRLLLEGRKDL